MAAARHLPDPYGEKNAATWPVTFTYNGTTLTVSAPAFKGVAAGDTVTFSNSANSTATIAIAFAANPTGVPNPPGASLWTDTGISLVPGASKSETVAPANASVNYTVTAAGNSTVFGPYAIQVGNGPIYIQITNLDSQPDPIAVPAGGTLEIYSNDSDTYTVKFAAGFNPFPTITEAKPGAGNNTPGTQVGPANIYDYEIVAKTDLGLGGGKVVVT